MSTSQKEPLFVHNVVRDRLHEQLAQATDLGSKKIPIEMTWPLALLKRELRETCETIDDALQMLLDQHTEGEWKAGEPGKPKKFVPAPVYATNEDGTPKFKLDKNGQPTAEREVVHGKVQLKNGVIHGREKREFMRGSVALTVPHLDWRQLAKVKELEPNIVEALMEYFTNVPESATPKAVAGKPDKPAAEASTAPVAKSKAAKPAAAAAAG